MYFAYSQQIALSYLDHLDAQNDIYLNEICESPYMQMICEAFDRGGVGRNDVICSSADWLVSAISQ